MEEGKEKNWKIYQESKKKRKRTESRRKGDERKKIEKMEDGLLSDQKRHKEEKM